MAGGVRLEEANAVGSRFGAAPGHVAAFAGAVVARQAAPDRIDRLPGVNVGEEAGVKLCGVADLAHLNIPEEEKRAVSDAFEGALDVLRDLSGRRLAWRLIRGRTGRRLASPVFPA